MPRFTATIGSATTTANKLEWTGVSIALPFFLGAGGNTRRLQRLVVDSSPSDEYTVIHTYFDDGTDQPLLAQTQDLTTYWERFNPALTIRAGSLVLRLPGPNSDVVISGGGADPIEPYSYDIPPGQESALHDTIQSFITSYASLTQETRNATTITFDDGLVPLKQTFNIGAGTYTFDDTPSTRINWPDLNFRVSDPLNSDFFLHSNEPVSRRTLYEVAFGDSAGYSAGEKLFLAIGGDRFSTSTGDLKNIVEESDRLITIKAGTFNYTFGGPASSDATTADTSAPYAWNLNSISQAKWTQIVQEYNALSQSDKNATQLIIDNGVDPNAKDFTISSTLSNLSSSITLSKKTSPSKDFTVSTTFSNLSSSVALSIQASTAPPPIGTIRFTNADLFSGDGEGAVPERGYGTITGSITTPDGSSRTPNFILLASGTGGGFASLTNSRIGFSGTVAEDQFPSSITIRSGGNTWTGDKVSGSYGIRGLGSQVDYNTGRIENQIAFGDTADVTFNYPTPSKNFTVSTTFSNLSSSVALSIQAVPQPPTPSAANTFTIGVADTQISGTGLVWQGNVLGEAVPDRYLADGITEDIYIARIILLNTGSVTIHLSTSSIVTAELSPREDFSDELESHNESFTFSFGSTQLTIPGPDYSGNRSRDPSDDYTWDPPSSVDIASFVDSYVAASASDKESATLTLDDGQGVDLLISTTFSDLESSVSLELEGSVRLLVDTTFSALQSEVTLDKLRLINLEISTTFSDLESTVNLDKLRLINLEVDTTFSGLESSVALDLLELINLEILTTFSNLESSVALDLLELINLEVSTAFSGLGSNVALSVKAATITAIARITRSGNRVQLDGTGSFGRPRTYRWKQISGPEVEIENSDSASASFNLPSQTEAVFHPTKGQFNLGDRGRVQVKDEGVDGIYKIQERVDSLEGTIALSLIRDLDEAYITDEDELGIVPVDYVPIFIPQLVSGLIFNEAISGNGYTVTLSWTNPARNTGTHIRVFINGTLEKEETVNGNSIILGRGLQHGDIIKVELYGVLDDYVSEQAVRATYQVGTGVIYTSPGDIPRNLRITYANDYLTIWMYYGRLTNELEFRFNPGSGDPNGENYETYPVLATIRVPEHTHDGYVQGVYLVNAWYTTAAGQRVFLRDLNRIFVRPSGPGGNGQIQSGLIDIVREANQEEICYDEAEEMWRGEKTNLEIWEQDYGKILIISPRDGVSTNERILDQCATRIMSGTASYTTEERIVASWEKYIKHKFNLLADIQDFLTTSVNSAFTWKVIYWDEDDVRQESSELAGTTYDWEFAGKIRKWQIQITITLNSTNCWYFKNLQICHARNTDPFEDLNIQITGRVERIYASTASAVQPGLPSNDWGYQQPQNPWETVVPTLNFTTRRYIWETERDIPGGVEVGDSVEDDWSHPRITHGIGVSDISRGPAMFIVEVNSSQQSTLEGVTGALRDSGLISLADGATTGDNVHGDFVVFVRGTGANRFSKSFTWQEVDALSNSVRLWQPALPFISAEMINTVNLSAVIGNFTDLNVTGILSAGYIDSEVQTVVVVFKNPDTTELTDHTRIYTIPLSPSIFDMLANHSPGTNVRADMLYGVGYEASRSSGAGGGWGMWGIPVPYLHSGTSSTRPSNANKFAVVVGSENTDTAIMYAWRNSTGTEMYIQPQEDDEDLFLYNVIAVKNPTGTSGSIGSSTTRRTVTETIYRRASSTPSAPSGGTTLWNHTPTGWNRTNPGATSSLDVYAATRTVTYEGASLTSSTFVSATVWGGVYKSEERSSTVSVIPSISSVTYRNYGGGVAFDGVYSYSGSAPELAYQLRRSDQSWPTSYFVITNPSRGTFSNSSWGDGLSGAPRGHTYQFRMAELPSAFSPGTWSSVYSLSVPTTTTTPTPVAQTWNNLSLASAQTGTNANSRYYLWTISLGTNFLSTIESGDTGGSSTVTGSLSLSDSSTHYSSTDDSIVAIDRTPNVAGVSRISWQISERSSTDNTPIMTMWVTSSTSTAPPTWSGLINITFNPP